MFGQRSEFDLAISGYLLRPPDSLNASTALAVSDVKYPGHSGHFNSWPNYSLVRARPCGLTQPRPVPRPLRAPARSTQCFMGTTSLSPGKPIPGSPSLTKKRKLFPGLPPTSVGLFALPHLAPRDGSLFPGSRILTRHITLLSL